MSFLNISVEGVNLPLPLPLLLFLPINLPLLLPIHLLFPIVLGDFAYDMHSDESKFADTFFNLVQPVAAYYPYMVCPGNHEWKYNFSNYVARFNMPNNNVSNHYYRLAILFSIPTT